MRLSSAGSAKLAGDSGTWHHWATSVVLGWKPNPLVMETPVIQIHGDADTTFPIRYTTPDVIIQGGGHVLPMGSTGNLVDGSDGPGTGQESKKAENTEVL